MWEEYLGMNTYFKKKVYVWRVGNGSNINIRDDYMIPNSSSRKITTVHGNRVLIKVVGLVLVSGEWDEKLNREIFLAC